MGRNLEPFDGTREFKALCSFRADGAIWSKWAAFDKSRVNVRTLQQLYEMHKLGYQTPEEAEAVKASSFSYKRAPSTVEVIPAHPELMPQSPAERADRIVAMKVADLTAALPSLDLDMLNRVRDAEAGKPDDGSRATALAAIDAAIAKLNPSPAQATDPAPAPAAEPVPAGTEAAPAAVVIEPETQVS